MSSSNSVRPGQTVAFTYNKGSKPNTQRVVEVADVDSTYIRGDDLTVDGDDKFRQFLRSEITGDVHMVADTFEEVVLASSFLVNPANVSGSTIELIYQSLNPTHKGVRYDDKANVIVMRQTNLPRVDLTVGDTTTLVSFVNMQGESLSLSFDHSTNGSSVNIPHRMMCRLDQKTLTEFMDALKNHVASPQTTVPGWTTHYANQVRQGSPLYAQ